MKKLAGIIPYLVSPIDPDGTVRGDVLSRLCGDLIGCGVHGLCALGSVGEFPYLTFDQKKEIVRTTIEAAAGKVPVVAGVSGYSVRQICDEAYSFVSMGVDALVVLLECYFPLSVTQMAEFFRSVARAVPHCPLVLYSNPKYMHYELPLDVFDHLRDVENILYYKDATGNTGRLLSMVNRFGDRFRIFSASAHIPLFVSMLGGVGWMAGPACLIPKQSVMLYDLCEDRDYQSAMELQFQIWEINRVFAKYDLTACVSFGLRHLGYEVGDPVAPLSPLPMEAERELVAIIDRLRAIPTSRRQL
ncbi:MAG: dihydrodipicolinate synthase family protein [Sphaerochaetaceae bacterium]|jgi:4-hydroxy-tetrahydrodipicolinate synthase